MDLDSDTYQEALLTFDWTDAPEMGSAVTMAVSAVSGDDPMAMEPLASVINPDAVAMLFAPTRNPTERVQGSVDFEYHGYRIVIKANGRGYIYDSTCPTPIGVVGQSGATVRADDKL